MARRRRAVLRCLALALPLVFAGCAASDDLHELDLSDLDDRFACADLTVVAASGDGSEALLIAIEDELVTRAFTEGRVVEAAYSLPDPRVTVRWAQGSNVYQGHCGRDSETPWRLDARSEAVAGELHTRVELAEDGALRVSTVVEELLLAPPDDPAELVYAAGELDLDGLPLEP